MFCALLAATAVWLMWRPAAPTGGPRWVRRTSAPPVSAATISNLLALVHLELAGGSLPRTAWSAALEAQPAIALPATRAAVALDGDLPTALLADASGSPELALAALVTRVCAATGASPSDPMELAVSAARDRVAVTRVIEQEVAATKASIAVLAGLPLLGLALGAMIGSDATWLLRTALGRGCLVAGLVCEGLGLVWLRRMVRRSLAP